MGRKMDGDGEWEKKLRALGLAVMRLQMWAEEGEDRTNVLQSLRFKLDADGGTGVLLIMKGVDESGQRIAFVGGLDLSTTVLAAARALRADVVRWREDKPWSGA